MLIVLLTTEPGYYSNSVSVIGLNFMISCYNYHAQEHCNGEQLTFKMAIVRCDFFV